MRNLKTFKTYLTITLLGFCSLSEAADGICDVLNLPKCESVHKMSRRASAQSAPSAGTATQFNPANVSHDRGFGVETFYLPSNPPTLTIVTGTGRMGAGFVTSKIENAFFGNRVPEIEADFLMRSRDQKLYSAKKYSFAVGAAMFKKQNVGLDLGLLFKYNEKIKKINMGPGVSLRVGPFTFGASAYKDDFYLESQNAVNPRTGNSYLSEWGRGFYKESFYVRSLFGGVKFKNLFFDVGQISTQYRFYGTDNIDSTVTLYSASYIWKKFLFNVAMRNEDSPSQKFEGNELVDQREQRSFYTGVQYSVNKFIVVGAHLNYYLLKDLSGSLTVFF